MQYAVIGCEVWNLFSNQQSSTHADNVGGAMRILKTIPVVSLSFMLAFNANAAEDSRMKEDNQHIRKWNGFADNALALHKELIKKHDHEVKKTVGGYAGNKNFYIQEQYYSKKTGQLLSQVQWEKANPTVLHSIEVYIPDDNGRVQRDFMAAYLPGYHNAPVQTTISFHQYSGKLHGFRTFDASGDRILERCEGEYKGKPFEFLLDEDELYSALMNGNPIDKEPYALCVGKLPKKLGKYTTPQ